MNSLSNLSANISVLRCVELEKDASEPRASDAQKSGLKSETDREYSASEIRKLLQQLFPNRRLVLSQFTFFNQIGIAKPSGETFRRGRRCYKLEDVLSIALVLALKEEGIPFKNIEELPKLVQLHAKTIFTVGEGCRVSGYGSEIDLQIPGVNYSTRSLETLIAESDRPLLFWSYDVGVLAKRIRNIALGGTKQPHLSIGVAA